MYLLIIFGLTAIIIYFITPLLSSVMFGKITSESLAAWGERTALLYALLPLGFFLMPGDWGNKTKASHSPDTDKTVFRTLALATATGALVMLFTVAMFRPLGVYAMLIAGSITLLGVGGVKAFSDCILAWNNRLGPLILYLAFAIFCFMPLLANLI